MRAGLAALFALALSAPSAAAEEKQTPERAYAEALRIAGEDASLGAELLSEFVRKHPRHPLADDAGLRVAQIHQTAGDRSDAQRALERVLALPPGDQTERARLRLALLERQQHADSEAYETARKLAFTALSGPERAEAHRLLADLALALGKPRARLRWLGQLRGDVRSSAQVAALDAEIDREIAALSDDALARTASALGSRVPAARRSRVAMRLRSQSSCASYQATKARAICSGCGRRRASMASIPRAPQA